MGKLKDVTLEPLAGRIVVRPTPAETHHGKIEIPEGAQTRPNDGEVIGVGQERPDGNGGYVPFVVKVGDRVIFSPSAGFMVNINDEKVLLMLEQEVLAIARPKGHA